MRRKRIKDLQRALVDLQATLGADKVVIEYDGNASAVVHLSGRAFFTRNVYDLEDLVGVLDDVTAKCRARAGLSDVPLPLSDIRSVGRIERR